VLTFVSSFRGGEGMEGKEWMIRSRLKTRWGLNKRIERGDVWDIFQMLHLVNHFTKQHEKGSEKEKKNYMLHFEFWFNLSSDILVYY
jgi:hypothetical protein